MDERKWTVYMHVCPDGRKYIGVTKFSIARRSGKNGSNYNRPPFCNAIKQFGWDNIEHKVIAVVDTAEDAARMETELIAKYNTTDIAHGFNVSYGTIVVDGMIRSLASPETRKKQSKSAKERAPESRNLSGIRHYYPPNRKGKPHPLTPQGANSLRYSNGKVVVQYTADFEVVGVYECAATAWTVTKINPYPALSDPHRKCGGYYWRYDDDLTADERIAVVFAVPTLYFHNQKGEIAHV